MAGVEDAEVMPSTALASLGASNTLLLVPERHRADLDGCLDLLTMREPDEENIWSLGVTLSANRRVENWETHVGTVPAAFRLVSVGELPDDEARETADARGIDPDPHFVTLQDLSDLDDVQAELGATLDEWTPTDRPTLVCFHSVTSLIEEANESRAFRLLSSFTAAVDEAGAIAHYHMDPGAHDDATVAKLLLLFDAVVEIDEEDNWHVTPQ